MIVTVNEKALKELLGHLVFSHSWHNFEVKDRAEELLSEVTDVNDEDEDDEGSEDKEPKSVKEHE